MSVVDDLKDTFGNSDNSSHRSKGRSSGSRSNSNSGFNSGQSPDPGSQNSGLDSSLDDGNLGNRQNSNSGNLNRHGNNQASRNPGRGQKQGQKSPGRRGDQQRQSGDNLPNAQAGRPEQGSSRPQVSSQTQRKMENAGFQSDNSRQQESRGQGLERSADLQELKSQNEQIINLLKRINRNLEQLGR